MKRRILLGMLIASSLFAKAEISVSVGTNSFDSDEHLDTATTLGIRGDFYLDNMYHLDLGYDYLGDVNFKGTSNSINIERYYTQFSADGAEEYHVVPSLSVGLGYEKQDGVFADSEPFISLGIGFRYNVSTHFNFLLGTKALWKTDSRDIDYHSTFGVGYLFGVESVNNKDEAVEEVVIPKEKLKIPELHTPVAPVQKKEIIVDTKEASVVPQPVVIHSAPMGTEVTEVKVVSKPQPQRVVSQGTFIQVAAFTQYKPTSLLNRLAASGKHIILRHQGSVTKALVGPYRSPLEAQKALYSVKKIAPGAFIYKGN